MNGNVAYVCQARRKVSDYATLNNMDTEEETRLLHRISTSGQPDCVKVFPFDTQDATLKGAVIAATYEYNASTRDRTGNLIAFNCSSTLESLAKSQIDDDKEENEGIEESFPITSVPLPGVLSCSWVNKQDFYAATCLTADLRIVTLKVDTEGDSEVSQSGLKMDIFNEIKLDAPSDAVGLSLVHYNDDGRLSSVTSSQGFIYIVEDGLMSQKWRAHEMETWASAFQPGNPNVVLTASDDSMVKIFDRRRGIVPVHTLKRHFSGATSINFKEERPDILYTGGFDRQMVKFDMRNLSCPMATTFLDCSLWYIDYMPNGMLNIAGCYDGAFMYHVDEQDKEYRLIKKFSPKNPLIYGVAHLQLNECTVQLCCDFYNKGILFWI